MKTQLLTIFAVVVTLLCFCEVQAGIVEFYSDANIMPGDVYDTVLVYDTPPNHTTITMTGGYATEIGCFDTSALNMSGGEIGNLSVFDTSTLSMSGGEIDLLSSIEQSTVNISGGSIGSIKVYNNSFANLSQNATIFEIQVHDTATFDMNGGTIDYLGALYSSILNLYGGDITKALIASSFVTINVFGKNLAKTDTGGTYGFGQVTGLWQNDLPFTINLDGSDTYSRVKLIPEPATFLLLGAGAVLLRRKH